MSRPRSFLQKTSRRLFAILVVTVVWSSFSIFISTMLSTTTLSPQEAQGVVGNLKAFDISPLWGVVIPVSFFLVLATRPKQRR